MPFMSEVKEVRPWGIYVRISTAKHRQDLESADLCSFRIHGWKRRRQAAHRWLEQATMDAQENNDFYIFTFAYAVIYWQKNKL